MSNMLSDGKEIRRLFAIDLWRRGWPQSQIADAMKVTALALLALPLLARANDSEGGFANGMLELRQNKSVVMESENLFVSQYKITVDYVFQNESDHDEKITVAFPTPEYHFDDCSPDREVSDFKVKADGKDVSYKTEIKADGKVVKEFPRTQACGDPPTRKQVTYYWEQTFPLRKPLRIQHSYAPSFFSTVALPYAKADREFCLGETVGVKRAAKMKTSGALQATSLEYVLKSGANWKGPIRKFSLTIEKPSPDSYLSTCFPGHLKKTSPTQFVFEASNFEPKENLKILFFK